jgi:beta-1,4-mannosyl-glycoprotein beta-1,4-N-acetylglucosaminyltransferase
MAQTLGGSIFVRNAIRFGYCIIEALESLYALCDEISILECGSDDGTQALLREWIASKGTGKKIHAEFDHPWKVAPDYSRLAILANIAKSKLTTDWHFMLQADEVIHETAFGAIRVLIERPATGYYCRRLNLFVTPDTFVRLDSNKKPCGDVVCRLAKTHFQALLDAESLAVDGGLDRSHIDKIVIFHYGFVRNGSKLIAKGLDMQSWFFGKNSTPDQRIVQMHQDGDVFRPEVYFSESDLSPIPIPHPMFSQALAVRLRAKPKIYDGFMFYNELELLEIRLNELDAVVDKFILVEADTTFSGKKKPLVFQENKERFAKFLDKIAHVVVTDMPEGSDPWPRECFQRNAIVRGIPKDASSTDLLIITDVDEIPRARAILEALPLKEPMALDMGAYSGFLNVYWGEWIHAKILPLGFLNGSTPHTLRHQGHNHIKNAGWHFSYIGGPEMISMKMTAFAHQEPSVQRHNNVRDLQEKFRTGSGIFGGVMVYRPIDESFPEYLVKNVSKFQHLIGPQAEA